MDSNKLNRAKKKEAKKKNDNDSNKNSLFGWNNFSQQQIGARQTNTRMKKRTQEWQQHEEKVWIAWMFCLSTRSLQMSGADKYYCFVRCSHPQQKIGRMSGGKCTWPKTYTQHTHTVLKHSASKKRQANIERENDRKMSMKSRETNNAKPKYL